MGLTELRILLQAVDSGMNIDHTFMDFMFVNN
jgi:hypothetical protein